MLNPRGIFANTLKLALSTTRPDGSAAVAKLRDHLQALGESVGAEVCVDEVGNLWCGLGGSTIFTAHLDTVAPHETPVKLVMRNGLLSSDGATVMGADDGAGIAILAGLMAARKPAMYLFTQAEETGGRGARHAASAYAHVIRDYQRAVAFDRKGTVDICGSQCVGTLASEEFVSTLAERLGMGHTWADGVYTDNAEFQGLVPEIVNIACGYEGNHSKKETLDTSYLSALFDAALALDWDALPTIGVPEEAGDWRSPWGDDDADTPEALAAQLAEDLGVDYLDHRKDYDLIVEAIEVAYWTGRYDRKTDTLKWV